MGKAKSLYLPVAENSSTVYILVSRNTSDSVIISCSLEETYRKLYKRIAISVIFSSLHLNFQEYALWKAGLLHSNALRRLLCEI